MKKTVFLLAVGFVIFFTSCETTKEITIQQNGSGNYTSTIDMGGVLGMIKGMVPPEKLSDDKLNKAVDTTIDMAVLADEMKGLSDADKNKVKKGTVGLKLNLKEDQLVTKLSFPFSNVNDIGDIDRLNSTVLTDFIKNQMDEKKGSKENPLAGMGELGDKMGKDMPNVSVDEYYTIKTSSGVIERKLDQAKFDKMPEDEKEGRKQMGSMGAGSSTLVINLPKPVKKTTGKNITISEDKKKVTIVSDAEDFMTTPKDLEFKIEY
jgi:hypothetical protein